MNMLRRLALVLLAVGLVACASPEGRIMDDSEEDYVGKDAAGAASYDRLIEGAVQKLLQQHSATGRGVDQLKIACLEFENAGSEELGDWQNQLFDLINTSINQSMRYRTISDRFVSAGLRETRLRRDDLFIPAKRRQFIDVMESAGNPVDALLFPKLTTGSTRGEDTRQRNYLLTLELVDVKTGENEQVSERLRKAYTN
ncbi:MAG: penicillin-binding protein activator LpoB [Planctomycetota bacterium]